MNDTNPDLGHTEPAPAPVFDAADQRQKVIKLEWPFTLDGKIYKQVIMRRMTQADVADMVRQMNAAEAAGLPMTMFPMFYDMDGVKLTDDVYGAMDADDAAKLDEAARDFLPRRFAPATE